MKTFALLVLAIFLVSCGTGQNQSSEDIEDITIQSEESEMRDTQDSVIEVGNEEDDTYLDIDEIEAEWEEARERSEALDFVGLTEDAASQLARDNNTSFRVVMRDDEMLPVTMDYRPGRINAQVEEGIVTSFSVE